MRRETNAANGQELGAVSHCCFCSMQCSVNLERDTSTGMIEKTRPNPEFPVASGKVCSKGLFAHEHPQHPERLTTPMIRRQGVLVETTWKEALRFIVERIQTIQQRYGRDAMAVYGGGSLTNESAYLLGKFARVALGTSNIDYNGRYCMSSAAMAMNKAFGIDRGLAFPLEDIRLAKCILLVGTNLADCQPTLIPYLLQAKKNGAKVIVIDPRKTGTAKFADLYVSIKPGTDIALMNGILHVMIQKGLINDRFIKERTIGFDAVGKMVSQYSPFITSLLTGVSEATIIQIAQWYGQADTAMLLTARGIEQQAQGVHNVLSCLNLVLASGKIGRPGCGYGAITGQANGQGGREHGQKADQLPGYRSIENVEDRQHIASLWGISEQSLPGKGKSAYELFEAMADNEIKGLFILASNPIVSSPNSNFVKDAFRKLDLIVVTDLFLTETAEMADVVLPGSAWTEAFGTITNLEGRVLLRNKAQDLPGLAQEDWRILCDLAAEMGKGEYFRYSSAEEVFNDLRVASSGGKADYAGITYERIQKEQGVFWPCPSESGPGTQRLFTRRFAHPHGKAVFHPVRYVDPAPTEDSAYPYVLSTGRVVSHYLTGVQTHRTRFLHEKCSHPYVEVHPLTAKKHGLMEGDGVEISSKYGKVQYPVRITDKIHPAMVFVPFHWEKELSINQVIGPQLDPISKIPAFKWSAVNLKKVVGEEVRHVGKRRLVLVGNGMAGIRCIEEILAVNPDRFDITVFGSETHPNYNRILLSSVLNGDATMKDIILNDWDWYKDNQITLHAGHTVIQIDTEHQKVYTDSGLVQPYDDLILATGSVPRVLPLPGADKQGVITFRNINDCQSMVDAAKQFQKAVVIGGGLLGLEAARGLLNLSMETCVVHIHDNLMDRQLDEPASKLLQAQLEEQGMKFILGRETQEIIGDEQVAGIRFTDGSLEPADLIVMAVGIRPNIQLAEESGILVNQGVVVNDFLETNVNHVYALGECAEHRGKLYGLVAPLFEQARTLAAHICQQTSVPYEGSLVHTKLKVSEVQVFSAGEFKDSPDTRAIRVQDELAGIYKKVLLRNNKVVGAVLLGETTDSQRFIDLIHNQTDVSRVPRAQLLENAGSVTQVPSEHDMVCTCNAVPRSRVVRAIRDENCQTVADVKTCTRATGTCGACKPTVEKIISDTLGRREPICSCTPLSRDEVLAEIKARHLTSVFEVIDVLGWRESEGCSKCRPALNYYLNMIWPAEHEDEPRSRGVNERLHANIQKDGTYSIVPRMYGGVTTPTELKRIAEIAEKYRVRMVKVTGGQRIDLLGVEKSDLPSIWAELDMQSGYAYGKAVRTVKTCVGSEFCRFGVQDSTQLGIDIEKKFERLNTPAKVKMAVSGCPRNCAEGSIKDVGVVGVEAGWEIYVGGNGGLKLRGAELLCVVKTKEEAMSWIGAFLQYYRENGVYGERTAVFVERLGIEKIRDELSQERTREALVKRVHLALSVLEDPWRKIIQSSNQDEFRELTPQH